MLNSWFVFYYNKAIVILSLHVPGVYPSAILDYQMTIIIYSHRDALSLNKMAHHSDAIMPHWV